MKKMLMLALALGLVTGVASADVLTFGWETGTPDILGMFGTGAPPMLLSVSTTTVNTGAYSLRIEDNSPSGTPQAFVAWVTGLSDGDVVTAGFARFDDTPGASPSVRIWGHWNDDPGDINAYNGSAGGNGDYGLGEGWDYHEHTWTVADGHTGLVIEARTYSSIGDTVWIDDLRVEAPSGATILMPDLTTPVAGGTWSQVKSLY